MKKAAALITAILTIVLALSSCGLITFNGDDTQDSQTVTGTDSVTAEPDDGPRRVDGGAAEKKKEAEARVSALPSREFSKDTFTVTVSPGMTFAPASATDGYDEAIIARNGMVARKYSIAAVQVETPVDLMLSDSYSAYLAGQFYSDVMMIPQSAVGAFAEKGFLLNVHSLPFADYGKDWYDLAAMDQAAAGYGAYAVVGSATKDIGCYYCLYVNTALLESLGIEFPRTQVENGSWTWQTLLDGVRGAAAIDGGYRAIGAATAHDFVCAAYGSSGQNFMLTGLGKTPRVAFETQATQTVVDVIKALRGSDALLFDQYSEGGSAVADFRAGRALYLCARVSDMAEISTMGGDWCVLPMPKTDASLETYYSYCSPDAPVFVIGSGAQDQEDTIYALDAYGAASYEYLDRCYYDRLIRTALNNSRTLDMLDYVCGIKGGRGIYEFTVMFGVQYPQLAENTADALWELGASGTLADTAYASGFALNWRMNNAFPVVKP